MNYIKNIAIPNIKLVLGVYESEQTLIKIKILIRDLIYWFLCNSKFVNLCLFELKVIFLFIGFECLLWMIYWMLTDFLIVALSYYLFIFHQQAAGAKRRQPASLMRTNSTNLLVISYSL